MASGSQAARILRRALPRAFQQISRAPRSEALCTSPGCVRRASTHLGAYLERAGAIWGDAIDSHEVRASPSGDAWSWQIDLPPDRLRALRRGEPLESPPFHLGSDQVRARFQFFPKGDLDCEEDGRCSLWLWTDQKDVGPISLRLHGAEQQSSGASNFCRLEDVLHDGRVEVSLQLQASSQASAVASAPPVEQSLQVTGLQLAEWRVFQMQSLFDRGELLTSPPFRFHHVLLGDMYLELKVGAPHPGFCTVFFHCRVPTMKLKVNIEVGNNFSKSFIALGRSSSEDNAKKGDCLEVNLGAPGVIENDGSLRVRCTLEEVVSLPPALRDMIPRLDERALWPKRL